MAKFKYLPSEMIEAAESFVSAIEGIKGLKLTREDWKRFDTFKKAIYKLPTITKENFEVTVSADGGLYSITFNDELLKIKDYFHEDGDRWQTTKWVISTFNDPENEGELWSWVDNLKGFINLNLEELSISFGEY